MRNGETPFQGRTPEASAETPPGVPASGTVGPRPGPKRQLRGTGPRNLGDRLLGLPCRDSPLFCVWGDWGPSSSHGFPVGTLCAGPGSPTPASPDTTPACSLGFRVSHACLLLLQGGTDGQ